MVYEIVKRNNLSERELEDIEHGRSIKRKVNEYCTVNMNWAGANEQIQVLPSQKQSYYHSYGGLNVKSDCFKKITYRNVYENIDIEYVIPEEKENGIKYNVVMHPGADPSKIKIVYSGDVKKIIKRKNGEVQIETTLCPIIEHLPLSFTEDGNKVESEFSLTNNTIGFQFPKGYEKTKKLIIDPWVSLLTTLSTNNYGYDVDYDFAGNLYVFGGITTYKIAKYDPSGVLLWTFSGVVAVPPWTSSGNYPYPLIGNFLVEKNTQRCYTGQGWVAAGTRIVRIDANGIYNNYITTANAFWNECWDLGVRCSTGEIIGFGGGDNSNNSGGLINTITGAVNPQSFNPGIPATPGQDVANNAIDDNGDVFVIFSSVQTPFLNNKLAKVNPTFNGNIWLAPSQYNSLVENSNKANYTGSGLPGGSSNGFNCLAVNASFLYYYDGFNLAAYNKINGVRVGFTTIAGQNVRSLGGIAVDDCNNVYVGADNLIRSFNFNGNAFTALPSVNVNAPSPNKFIYDLKLDRNTNLLYASGSGFAGVFTAINSLTCTNNQFTVTSNCNGNNSSIAVASVSTNIISPLISYTWSNPGGTISVTSNTTALTNTLNLTNGPYTVAIQINAPCGPVYVTTLNINCIQLCSVVATASTGCSQAGATTSLAISGISGYTPAPTFSWIGPSSFTSNLQNVNFLNSNSYGTYTVTVSNGICTFTTTVITTPVSQFTPVITNNSLKCFGDNSGTATVNINGGTAPFTYTWTSSPIQNNQNAIGLSAGVYTCTATDAFGCSFQATTSIIQPPPLGLVINSNQLISCVGSSVNLSGLINGGTTPYNFSWIGGPNTISYNVIEFTSGVYEYTLNILDANSCSISAVRSITFTNLALPIDVNSVITCFGSIATFTATGGANYNWLPSGAIGNTFSLVAVKDQTFMVLGNDNGCTGSAIANLIVNPLPTVTMNPEYDHGCAPFCTDLKCISTNFIVQFNWFVNDLLISSTGSIFHHCYDQTGTYKIDLSVTDNNGCKNIKKPIQITVHPKPQADFTFRGKLTEEDPEVYFTDQSYSNISNWFWYFGDGGEADQKNPEHRFKKAGMFNTFLVVTNDFGCKDTTQKFVHLKETSAFYIPNSFSPNGDGINDLFYAKSSGVIDFEITIFDRWGEKVFEAMDINKAWDGSYKGKPAKEDTYTWLVKVSLLEEKARSLSGTVTLIR